MTAEHICTELGLDIDEVFNIYPYGSRVYGTQREDSDYDYIIVFKSSMLHSGAFKDNAVSNKDRTIQGSCYGRGGFIDAINNFQLPALEAISTEAVKYKFPFNLSRYDENEMIKKVITQSSNSYYIADSNWNLREHPGVIDKMKKGVWHSIRIVMFGIQFKKHKKIIDFTEANTIFDLIMNDNNFSPRNYILTRDDYINKLKTI